MSASENPYGVDHQRRREELLPDAYGQPCPRCGKPMLRGQDLHLGHSEDLATNPQAVGDRIEHAHCNVKAGGELGSQRAKFRPSRTW